MFLDIYFYYKFSKVVKMNSYKEKVMEYIIKEYQVMPEKLWYKYPNY